MTCRIPPSPRARPAYRGPHRPSCRLIGHSLALIFAVLAHAPAEEFPVAATFSETIITLRWDSIPSVAAYNVYADLGAGPLLLNPVPIRSRASYSLFWHKENGKKKKIVKGNAIQTWVVALEGEACEEHGDGCRAVARSDTVCTCYFEGFGRALTREQCAKTLRDQQTTTRVLADPRRASGRTFLRKYPRIAARIDSLYRTMVDPRDEGACVPFSTMVAKYLSARGIPCYRCNGAFIKQFHSFNLVVLDGVEYVLDFTADQFVPHSAPVFIPRDHCFIDSTGRPTDRREGTVTAMYLMETVYRADQVSFTATPRARRYRGILDTLLTE